jgi:molybdenum-dependent DNA-binding transcriptional regulator ModE
MVSKPALFVFILGSSDIRKHKMLKKLVAVTAVVVMGLSMPTTAAEENREKPSKEQRLVRMQEHLNLSDDQVEEIRSVHSNGGGRDEIGAILTDDQRGQLRSFRKSGKEGRNNKMREHLNLSDEQVSQIQSIKESGGGREEIAAVLTDDQRQQMHEFKKNHKKMREQGSSEPVE